MVKTATGFCLAGPDVFMTLKAFSVIYLVGDPDHEDDRG